MLIIKTPKNLFIMLKSWFCALWDRLQCNKGVIIYVKIDITSMGSRLYRGNKGRVEGIEGGWGEGSYGDRVYGYRV